MPAGVDGGRKVQPQTPSKSELTVLGLFGFFIAAHAGGFLYLSLERPTFLSPS